MGDDEVGEGPSGAGSDVRDAEEPSRRVAAGERHRWELIVAIILSIATVLSAWSGYESTRWGAKVTRANRAAADTMFKAEMAHGDGQQEQMTETSLFIEWVRAKLDGDTSRADFIEARFRPAFVSIFNKWMHSGTAAGGLPPGSPFTTKGYTTPGFVRSDKRLAQVRALQDKADHASRTSQTYVLIAVLFASVLFFGGVATSLKDHRAALLMASLAGLGLIVAIVELLTQPVLFLVH